MTRDEYLERTVPTCGSALRKLVGAGLLLSVPGLMCGLVACAGDDPAATATAQESNSPTSAPSPATPTIATRTTPLGTVLTDAEGHTLYYLTTEAGGQDQCTLQPGCSLMWPALALPSGGDPVAASSITGTVGVVTAADGTMEVTYNGWPLHTYGNEAPGLVTGEAQQAFGGAWYVATPELAPAPSSGTPSLPAGPGLTTPLGPAPTNPFSPTTPVGFPTPTPLPTIPSGLPTEPT